MLSKLARHRREGFTLIELMIVVAILSICFAIALPELRSVLNNSQIRSYADELLAGLQLARAEAIRSNAPVTITLAGNANNNAGWVITDNAVPPITIDQRSLNEGTSLVNLVVQQPVPAADPMVMTFNGLGQMIVPAAQPVQILVRSAVAGSCITDAPAGPNRCLNLRIAIGGRIQLCDPNPALSMNNPQRCI